MVRYLFGEKQFCAEFFRWVCVTDTWRDAAFKDREAIKGTKNIGYQTFLLNCKTHVLNELFFLGKQTALGEQFVRSESYFKLSFFIASSYPKKVSKSRS